jgi:hypothetical protein
MNFKRLILLNFGTRNFRWKFWQSQQETFYVRETPWAVTMINADKIYGFSYFSKVLEFKKHWMRGSEAERHEFDESIIAGKQQMISLLDHSSYPMSTQQSGCCLAQLIWHFQICMESNFEIFVSLPTTISKKHEMLLMVMKRLKINHFYCR